MLIGNKRWSREDNIREWKALGIGVVIVLLGLLAYLFSRR
jgi:hypothetical protein